MLQNEVKTIPSTHRISLERIFNFILGWNVIAWGCLGVANAAPEDRRTVVRICVATLHVVVGCLFLARRSAAYHGRLREMLYSAPSLVVCGLAFSHAPAPALWPWLAEMLFAAGAVTAIISLVSLGRNFSVFPALRRVTISGPYNFVRHPAYAGETLMMLACYLAQPSNVILVSIAAYCPLLALRIHMEEKVLAQSTTYEEYKKNVRWRLVPGVW